MYHTSRESTNELNVRGNAPYTPRAALLSVLYELLLLTTFCLSRELLHAPSTRLRRTSLSATTRCTKISRLYCAAAEEMPTQREHSNSQPALGRQSCLIEVGRLLPSAPGQTLHLHNHTHFASHSWSSVPLQRTMRLKVSKTELSLQYCQIHSSIF